MSYPDKMAAAGLDPGQGRMLQGQGRYTGLQQGGKNQHYFLLGQAFTDYFHVLIFIYKLMLFLCATVYFHAVILPPEPIPAPDGSEIACGKYIYPACHSSNAAKTVLGCDWIR